MSLLVLALIIFLCAGLKGVIFPIAHHLGSVAVTGQIAKSVSRVYFFNILGATLGPLITGFVLLDVLTLQQTMLAMGWLATLLGIACLARDSRPRIALAGVVIAIGLAPLFTVSDLRGLDAGGAPRRRSGETRDPEQVRDPARAERSGGR